MQDKVMRTDAIKRFLTANTHADLAGLYNAGQECQVNVARDNGEQTTGTYQGREFVSWTDGLSTWKAFRIPYNAGTEPTYEDKPLTFSLDQHADGIGMTGWDWLNKCSRFVAYDFDSIVGHAEGHTKKLTATELDELKQVVYNVPWLTLRKSTGGNGLHLYVLLNAVPTKNHTEHAALARSILHMLSGLTGYEFSSKVDVCGGNMWVWHRKLTKSSGEGLKLLKQGGTLEQIPPNWMDHIRVVTGRTSRVHLQQIGESPSMSATTEEEMFDQLTSQRSKIALDIDHKKLINWLMDNKCFWWWDNNMWMLVTHTTHLKAAHAALALRGVFNTTATGRDGGLDHNCFAYPLRNGGWVIRRYTPGTGEAATWQQDGKKWTRCFYNREMDVPTACAIAGGSEHPNGGFYFGTVEAITKALTDLRVTAEVPDFIKGQRHCHLKLGKTDGKIVVQIDVELNDPKQPVAGWILEKKRWTRVFSIASNATPDEIEKNENYDDIVRHLVSEDGQDRGWMIKGQDNTWREEPLVHVKLALKAQNFPAKDIDEVIGIQVVQAWKLVNRPFEPEYPGNREWNRNAAQLAYIPSRYSDALAFPTWQLLLEHCGRGLDEAIKTHEWCQKSSVLNGADYLKLWIASLIKFPTRPLPYLFLWSTEQNTGKSSLHTSLALLFTKGCMNANAALTSTSDFNGEIEHSVLCYIEEKDLSKGKSNVYNRIKDWVTSPKMLIHPKHVTPYLKTNTTHWIQCSNDPKACPVFPGDTRITMINVPVIPADLIIVPQDLEHRLKQEAPDFLAYLLRMDIPDSNDRLNVPFIGTADKFNMAEQNKTPLQLFIEQECHHVPGHVILFAEFYEKFIEWLDAQERGEWSKIRVGKELPMDHPRGRLTTNVQVHVANLAFEQKEAVGPRWTVDEKGFLRQLPTSPAGNSGPTESKPTEVVVP